MKTQVQGENGIVQVHPVCGQAVAQASSHHLFIRPLVHSPNMHSVLGGGVRMENTTDLPELTPSQGGMGRSEENMIRQGDHCSDGGSRGQGRGV